MKYIDIHTHTYYKHDDVIILQNVFPTQGDQLGKDSYYSVGLHPWYIENSNLEEDIQWISENSLRKDVIAIGETGLDKAISCPWDKQLDVFQKQIKIAEEARKPVILHCVRSYSEILEYRKRSDQSIPWIFHWFSASLQTAEQLTRKNCYLSFGHMLFNDKSKSFSSFLSLHPSHIFFETDDAGYNIFEVYERAAQIKKVSMEELGSIIYSNFTHCFNL